MNLRRYFSGIFIIGSLVITQRSQAQLPEGFVKILVEEGLNPTSMTIAPDGRLFIAEKDGRIIAFRDDIRQIDPFLEIEVDNYNERGLSGIVFHPEFEQNQWIYVYYSVPGGNRNRLSRFTGNGDFVIPGSEEVLLNLDPLSGTVHNGGALKFGPDGKLYVSVGDGAVAFAAQSMESLLGKVLRLNDDGTIPADNPFYNTLEGMDRAIWAYGLRNSFSMDFNLAAGVLFANDVGGDQFEEINHIQEGKNYGWPLVEGYLQNQSPPQDYVDPVFAYDHSNGCAVVGAAFYTPINLSFPANYHGGYFFADYCGGYIKVLDPDSGDIIETFATGIDRPLSIVFDENGDMYYLERAGLGGGSEEDNTATPDGALWKVTYQPMGPPVIAVQPQSILVSVGESAVFEVEVDGSPPISYQWQRDNVDIVGENMRELIIDNVALNDDGDLFQCVATNSEGSVTSSPAQLNVTSNTRPVPVINSPSEGMSYQAGDTLWFEGIATDAEDASIPDDAYFWWIDFHHDEHTHPALESFVGPSGYYVIPRMGETDHNTWYRVYLKVTDSGGLPRTVFHEVFPEKINLQFVSEPPGIELNVDGKKVITPGVITAVSGTTRTVAVTEAIFDANSLLIFSQWSNGNESSLISFNAPVSDTTLTAQYVEIAFDDGIGLLGKYYSNHVQNFEGQPDLIRLDTTINFDWALGSPDEGIISVDDFTARWTGGLTPLFSETYTFYTASDDGVRLWVDDRLIIDQWIPQPVTEWSGIIDLVAGEEVPVELEFFEQGGEAVIKLFWSSQHTPKQIVPKSQFTSSVITGITEGNSVAEKALVFPNPVDQYLYINLRENFVGGYVRIFDLNGRIQFVSHIRSYGLTRLTLGHLKQGPYVILVTNRNEFESFRFIKH